MHFLEVAKFDFDAFFFGLQLCNLSLAEMFNLQGSCVLGMYGLFGGLSPPQKLDMTAPNGLELQAHQVFLHRSPSFLCLVCMALNLVPGYHVTVFFLQASRLHCARHFFSHAPSLPCGSQFLQAPRLQCDT